MSTTNSLPRICGRCKATVPPGTGTVRRWNGAARKHAPGYAIRSATGILSACTCVKCEAEINATLDARVNARRARRLRRI